MDQKRFSLVGLALLLCATLLSGCFEIPRDTSPETPGDTTSITPDQAITPTPVPSTLSGCTNIRSTAFNMGAAEGKTICLEGVIYRTNMLDTDSTAYIDFDTRSSTSGNILYYISIFINDRFAFGLDNIKLLSAGTHVAVTGRFAKNTSNTWLIRVNDPIDVIIIV